MLCRKRRPTQAEFVKRCIVSGITGPVTCLSLCSFYFSYAQFSPGMWPTYFSLGFQLLSWAGSWSFRCFRVVHNFVRKARFALMVHRYLLFALTGSECKRMLPLVPVAIWFREDLSCLLKPILFLRVQFAWPYHAFNKSQSNHNRCYKADEWQKPIRWKRSNRPTNLFGRTFKSVVWCL